MDRHQESDVTPLSLGLWNQVRDEPMEQENYTNESPPSTEFELTKNKGCTNLQQMIEDCLREIFSLKTLSTADLCSAAETCKRFQEITQSIFPKTIKIEGRSASYYIVQLPDCGFGMWRKNLNRIFRNFGSNLSEVEINGRDSRSNRYLFPLVTKYCRAGNLKSLTIKWINITKVSAVKLKRVFKTLQKLELCHVRVAGDGALFSKLDSLVDLTLVDVENCSTILENIFKKLERFEFNADICTEQTLGTLSTFISRHQSLKTLILNCLEADCTKRRILQVTIDSCCNELEELSIDLRTMNGASLQQLKKFRSLRALTLAEVSFENFKLFSVFTKLRTLMLSECKLPKDSYQFTYLSQLTVLKLQFCTNRSFDVVDIISQLTNLQEMEIFTDEGKFVLNEKTFARIVDMVKDRPHVLQLTCTVDFTVPNYDGKQRARLHDLEASLGDYVSEDDFEEEPGDDIVYLTRKAQ